MKKTILPALAIIVLLSCSEQAADKNSTPSSTIAGTWKLFSATTITKNDTVLTDYTKDQEMLKILNESHFAFIRHDLNKGKDTSKAVYSSGGGKYTLTGNNYTEHLDFCDAREWEGHTFNFTVTVSNDTLIQQGVEKLENLGIDRVIIERYIKVK